MVDSGGLFPYQSARIEGSLPGPSMFLEGDSVNTCLNEAGQSDSHSILESNGGTILFPPLPAGDRHMELVPCTTDYTPCRVPAWYREYQGRLGVEAPWKKDYLKWINK